MMIDFRRYAYIRTHYPSWLGLTFDQLMSRELGESDCKAPAVLGFWARTTLHLAKDR